MPSVVDGPEGGQVDAQLVAQEADQRARRSAAGLDRARQRIAHLSDEGEVLDAPQQLGVGFAQGALERLLGHRTRPLLPSLPSSHRRPRTSVAEGYPGLKPFAGSLQGRVCRRFG